MLRSFIARPQPLLSHLRRRAAAAPDAAKRRNTPSRAYATEDLTARRKAADGRTAAAPNLYVVLEEINKGLLKNNTGFGIYKLDIDGEDAVAGGSFVDEAPCRLPDPAVRLAVSLVGPTPRFEALGSKIVVTGDSETLTEQYAVAFFITLVYDTKTKELHGGSPPKEWWLKPGYHAAAVGDKLCALEACDNTPAYLCLRDPVPEVVLYHEEWTWEQGPSLLPVGATGKNSHVKSQAVHPDGRTIFASSAFTFSLNTEDGKSARHGDWNLLFNGRAYYDGDLDAWIGIRESDGTDGGRQGNPYLCSCDVPDLNDVEGLLQAPTWKICKEELTFVKTPANIRCRTLVHTGHGRFCLAEIMPAPVGEEADPRFSARDGTECLLHVTMFRAKHGKNGELVVTPCQPGRSYLVPNCAGRLLGAFWM